ncbi:MAG: hypothetical protein ACTS22_09085 [Phycisphaerales bacterium]
MGKPVTEVGRVTIVDGHVHLRPRFDPSALLSSALANADSHAARLGASSHDTVLMLAEAMGEDAFDRLAAATGPVGRWRFESTAETGVLRAERDDGRSLLLIQGRQWACRERLEVLTLASGAREDAGLADGLPIREVIRLGLEAGALVTLPWGFGKWTGDRRRLMLELLEAFGSSVVVGDSAARPRGTVDPVIQAADSRGIPILPGTDPLPVPAHRARIARFGLWLDGFAPGAGVVPWLTARIRSSRPRHATIGQRDGPITALATQLRLRLSAS